jgi:hypothetical protein
MIVIQTLSTVRFSLNGIQYFKNYISEVAGDRISIYNAYDKKDVRVDWVHYGEVSVNGTTYGSASDLQTALLPVIYTRSSLTIGGGNFPDSLLSIGSITRDDNEFTFTTGFSWRISDVVYANVTPQIFTIATESEGFSRIDIVYLVGSNTMQIATGEPSDSIVVEPTIPAGAIILRKFNINGAVIDEGSGPALPYDINLLDLLEQDPQDPDFFLINVGGIDYRITFERIRNAIESGSFDPSNYDLEDFTNESSDPFVRQSEIPSGTTPDLDAVTQEGNTTRVEIVRDLSENTDEFADGLVFDYFGDTPNSLGWDATTNKIFIKSASSSEELTTRKVFNFDNLTIAKFLKIYQNEEEQQDFPIVTKNADFTANTNVFYLCFDDLEITDPTAQGYYKFFVINGTTTIGSETYTQGASVQRYYDGSDWVSVSGGNPTLNDVALNGNTSTVPLKVSGEEGIASYGVDPDSGYPLLESDQNDGNGIVHQLSHLTDKRIRFIVNDDAWEVTQISKNTNYTAINGQNYYNSGNIVVTDPSSGIYHVFVATGTTTIDSVAYPANTYLVRYLNASSVWVTRVLNATASPTVEGTTKLYDSLGTGTDGAVNRTVVTEEFAKSQKTLIQKTLGTVTGTTAETIISTLEILGGTFPSTTYFEWVAPLRKPNSSTPSFKLYLNTTPDLSGSPVQLALYTSASANRTMPFSRWFEVRGGNLIGSSSGTNQMLTTLGVLANQEGISTSYNVANTYYFIVTVANSDTSMTSECPFQKITLI